MSTYNLRRFAQPDVLKNIQQDNLITFLKRYESYLTGRGFSFELNEDNELDFETLCQVLMNPSEDMDIEFVEALFFIQEMSDDEHFEELGEQAEANNIDTHEDSTAADLALALWLHDPELLKRPHAEAMILKPKSFMYFQSDQKSPDTYALPKPETMRTLEADMDAWFLKNKRGTGCRILPVSAEDEDKTYFLIRHGMPFKREGKIESGQSKTIFYRPEFHDVIVYDRANNELAVFNKSGAKKERTMYLDLFSQHLFGQAEYFPGAEKYTLQPLIDNGVDALACADIDGLEDVKLIEIQHQFHGPYNDKQTLRSNDIFASLASRDKSFPAFGRLVSASFSVKFENAKRPRMVKVRTPNVANFDRKEDSHLIETWLRKRGFVNEQKEEEDSTQPVTHIRRVMTPYQSPPWRKLTELSGGKGVKAEWQDFPEEFLTITNEQASSIPCNGRAGCYMNVVRHGPSDIVGICTSDTKQCDRRTLKKSELALYRIDHKKLAAKIAKAIGFTEEHEKIRGHTALWKFGVLNPQAEHCFPVYCFLGQTSSQLDKVVNQLCMGEQTFLLIAATSSLISTASSDASSRHKSKLIGIDDVLAVDAAGKVTAKESAQTIVSNWLETVLPKSAKPGSEYQFPTPAGATWEQFVFEFTAKEMLSVTCGHTQQRLEPEHLKMKDQRSGKKTKQWTLLLVLAKTGGSLSWQDSDADDKLKKQKQELANKLKQSFGLSEDPLPWSRKENCYKARFIIRADDNVLRQLTG